MEVIRSSVSLSDYRQAAITALQSEDYVVFLDTNVFAWAFRLNEDASKEFFRWLQTLQSVNRLKVPAWVVHEYNIHLARQDNAFFSSHAALTKQLSVGLKEFERLAQLMAGENSATECGHSSKQDFVDKVNLASKTLRAAIQDMAKMDAARRKSVEESIEHLMNAVCLDSDIHSISAAAWEVCQSRSTNRLSPGFKDLGKTDNTVGDLVIWREILLHCRQHTVRNVIFLTNDRKTDWVYSPLRITLSNGRQVSGTDESYRLVKLPNPDLLSEFTGNGVGEHLHILTIDLAIDLLSTRDLNGWDSQEFRQLALAIKGRLGDSPTEQVIEWFIRNPERYQEAVKGVCRWQYDPNEVDFAAFERWTVEQTPGVKHDQVSWSDVFCELFL